MGEFYLDKSEEGKWLIKRTDKPDLRLIGGLNQNVVLTHVNNMNSPQMMTLYNDAEFLPYEPGLYNVVFKDGDKLLMDLREPEAVMREQIHRLLDNYSPEKTSKFYQRMEDHEEQLRFISDPLEEDVEYSIRFKVKNGATARMLSLLMFQKDENGLLGLLGNEIVEFAIQPNSNKNRFCQQLRQIADSIEKGEISINL